MLYDHNLSTRMDVINIMKRYKLMIPSRAFALIFLIATAQLFGQAPQQSVDPKLTVERIFASPEFKSQGFGGFQWLKDGESYAKFEPSEKAKGGTDLVRYHIETSKRDVLLSADKLIPAGETKPLDIDGYDWSPDEKSILIYTNSKKVWRYNTRGD